MIGALHFEVGTVLKKIAKLFEIQLCFSDMLEKKLVVSLEIALKEKTFLFLDSKMDLCWNEFWASLLDTV